MYQTLKHWVSILFIFLFTSMVQQVYSAEDLEIYRKVFFLDYCQRFPERDRQNFDAAMQPFDNYFKNIDAHKFNALDEIQFADEVNLAWPLLKQGLNG